MNEISQLQSMGLKLPSPAYLAGCLLFSIFGYVAYRRGKQRAVANLKWTGLGLMLYPYVVSETWMLWGIGIALSVWAYTLWD
jgi:hypothetical protein